MSNIYTHKHSSFIYIWYDGKKFYLGVHKGTPDDGYICSSKVMLEEYKLRPQDFRRRILAYGTYKETNELETELLKNRKEKGKWNKYYNIAFNFPRLIHTEEVKRNMSKAQKGRIFTEEHRRKLSEAHKGKIISKETKRKISEAGKGRKHTEESKRKMSETRRLRHREKLFSKDA